MCMPTSSSSHLILHWLIDLVDQPGESLSIDGFGQCVPDVDSMVNRKGAENLCVQAMKKRQTQTWANAHFKLMLTLSVG